MLLARDFLQVRFKASGVEIQLYVRDVQCRDVHSYVRTFNSTALHPLRIRSRRKADGIPRVVCIPAFYKATRSDAAVAGALVVAAAMAATRPALWAIRFATADGGRRAMLAYWLALLLMSLPAMHALASSRHLPTIIIRKVPGSCSTSAARVIKMHRQPRKSECLTYLGSLGNQE